MTGFLSTLSGGCKALFRSFTSTLSTLKKLFRSRITPIIQEIASFIRHFYQNHVRPFISDHPVEIAIAVFCIIVMTCPWIITTPLLYSLGFTILGSAAVSLAALAQSIIGSVSTGSIFAILQSAGMAGAGLVTINGIAVGIAALILLAVVVHLFLVQRMEREKGNKG